VKAYLGSDRRMGPSWSSKCREKLVDPKFDMDLATAGIEVLDKLNSALLGISGEDAKRGAEGFPACSLALFLKTNLAGRFIHR
jgi:hypothetical protein